MTTKAERLAQAREIVIDALVDEATTLNNGDAEAVRALMRDGFKGFSAMSGPELAAYASDNSVGRRYSRQVSLLAETPPLSEDDIANFLLERIEDGALDLGSIPGLMARYGLMESQEFIAEMAERIQMKKDEAAAG